MSWDEGKGGISSELRWCVVRCGGVWWCGLCGGLVVVCVAVSVHNDDKRRELNDDKVDVKDIDS